MTKAALPFVILALYLLVAGCSDSDKHQDSTSGKPGAANDFSGLCSFIAGAGLAKKCVVNSRDNLVGVTIDSFDDEVARNVCADIADKATRLTAHLSGWRLQVFSPYRSDKPMATCPFH
jgi:hypothetical protein